ncbi:hypothetical protein C5B42_05075 [Candidatus Cerribacteria bacterium 'Amazon FNV 2010 28 9']|uniref:Uncharacterized protein n=1 Tax=Candidatus Cerribacteria bacterium 'Amazon FNV 2010 28 9' TaxID=2081795 RepID=A0A317JP28_9BACT|nr:MAG: hypothetical protein C5B42_05075 [Candidatus Cerribacteria bacterium 'Amazon FNV 2010 28 9']
MLKEMNPVEEMMYIVDSAFEADFDVLNQLSASYLQASFLYLLEPTSEHSYDALLCEWRMNIELTRLYEEGYTDEEIYGN